MRGRTQEFLATLFGAVILLVAVVGVVALIAWLIIVNGALDFWLGRMAPAAPPRHPLGR